MKRSTMRAIVYHEYGPPGDVLESKEIDRPVVKDDEVLVRVSAASVHAGDWLMVRGQPYIARLATGLRGPKNDVAGTDVAGTVEAVGKDVKRFQPGDEVFGWCDGAFAEYACAGEDHLLLRPVDLTFEQAATVATSAIAALQALRDKGEVQPGQKVLIIGASGGVGTFAVQIGKSYGAEVTGVCSTRNVDMVRSIGADHVIDYTQEDLAQSGQRYDVIFDTAGNRSLSHLRRALTPKGTLVIGGGRGGPWLMGIDRQFRALVMSPFVSQRLRALASSRKLEELVVLKELIEAGKVTPVIDRSYPLSETPLAVGHVEEGHAQGKTVITV
jgi:NADPH:quinone reductase-like Zn-dependent oxidoreductase